MILIKISIIILVVICLVFSGISINVFAATISKEAQMCSDLGMLIGDGEGVTSDYLASSCTRLQGAVMLLRLTKAEKKALNYLSDSNFSDVTSETLPWKGGRNILAYLKANIDVGFAGYPDGSFGPNDLFTAQQYYKVLLQSLGYEQGIDFEWTEVFEFAESLGMTSLNEVNCLTMNHVAKATVEVLDINYKGDNRTLAEKLITRI